jgi:hypothetical protein
MVMVVLLRGRNSIAGAGPLGQSRQARGPNGWGGGLLGINYSPFIKLSRRGKTVLFVDRTAYAVVPTFLRKHSAPLRGAFFPPLDFLRREPPPVSESCTSPRA